jgi:predicted CoA-binding protein
MAGYSNTPLVKKLGIKEGFHVGFVNPPKGFQKELGPLPDDVKISVDRLSKPIDLIVLFTDSEQILKTQFSKLALKLTVNGIFWVAWPKKSSRVPSDLAFDNVQQIGLRAGLVDVKICAVNEIWSGLKFVYRLKDRKSPLKVPRQFSLLNGEP